MEGWNEQLQQFLDFTSSVAHYDSVGTRSVAEGVYLALGLTGESGEASDAMKKVWRDDIPTGEIYVAPLSDLSPERKEKILLELGDVLWYWVRLVAAMESSPAEIIRLNKDKLYKRLEEFKKGTREGKVG